MVRSDQATGPDTGQRRSAGGGSRRGWSWGPRCPGQLPGATRRDRGPFCWWCWARCKSTTSLAQRPRFARRLAGLHACDQRGLCRLPQREEARRSRNPPASSQPGHAKRPCIGGKEKCSSKSMGFRSPRGRHSGNRGQPLPRDESGCLAHERHAHERPTAVIQTQTLGTPVWVNSERSSPGRTWTIPLET